MKITDLKLFIEEYERIFEDDVRYNDDIGIYYFDKIDIYVKSWNNTIHLINDFEIIDLERLLTFIKRFEEEYYYSFKNLIEY